MRVAGRMTAAAAVDVDASGRASLSAKICRTWATVTA
jgi:hypothetical protein